MQTKKILIIGTTLLATLFALLLWHYLSLDLPNAQVAKQEATTKAYFGEIVLIGKLKTMDFGPPCGTVASYSYGSYEVIKVLTGTYKKKEVTVLRQCGADEPFRFLYGRVGYMYKIGLSSAGIEDVHEELKGGDPLDLGYFFRTQIKMIWGWELWLHNIRISQSAPRGKLIVRSA